MAFVARNPERKNLLWVRPLDSLTAQPLAGTEGAMFPFWSPDSRSVGFFAQGKLKKIDASGGPPQTLCDAGLGRGGSWSREGAIVFAGEAQGPLFRVSAAGGPATPATKLDAARQEYSHRWPCFLPDGRRFLYYVRTPSTENNGTYLGSLDGQESKLLVRGESNAVYAPPGYLLFARERALMAQPFDARRAESKGDPFPIAEQVQVDAAWRGIFSVSENGLLAYHSGPGVAGTLQLLWFDRAGKQGEAVGEPAAYRFPVISPDGQKLAVAVNEGGNVDIWVYGLARKVRTRLTFAPSIEISPLWSPDGTRIAFASNRKGQFDTYQKASSGVGSEEPLLESSAGELPFSWSSDGRYIAYARLGDAKTKYDIWVLPFFGDRKPFPFLQTEFDEFQPQFSPNGRWLAYASNESGKYEVYVAPFPGAGGKWQVSNGGGWQPRWRRDGKELFYLAANDTLMAAEINEKDASLEIGKVQPLFQAPWAPMPVDYFYQYDASADGKRFMANIETSRGSAEPITLVVNWTAQLKR